MKKNRDTKINHALAEALKVHQSGEPSKAITLYKKILRKLPTHPDALHYLGLAFYQLGDTDMALTHIQRALAVHPKYPDALNNLGNIYKETGQLENALETYTQIVKLAPEHADTRVNISSTLRDIKQPQLALQHLEKALEIEPEHAQAHHNLGNVYKDLKQFDKALVAYRHAISLDSNNHDAIKSSALILKETQGVDVAIDFLNQQLKQRPQDAITKHLLASLDGNNVPERANDRYVKETFDTFSASFDASLSRLEYKAPELVSAKVLHCIEHSSLNNDTLQKDKKGFVGAEILDIGCGTGLCGPLLQPIVKTLIGVDLSPKMLQKARKRNVYDELHEAELTAYMDDCKRYFDYVICVDTFVYFGTLSQAFSAAHRVLVAKGHFIFTAERNGENDKPYQLQQHGRYSHNKTYVRETLENNGFLVISIEDVVPRLEGGEPVAGMLVLAQKQ